MTWANAAEGRGWVHHSIDVKIDKRNVFAPDIPWYSQERRPRPDDLPPYPRPDLAIEVRSPSTWRYDVGAKESAHERHGLRELWLVDTAAAEVLVFRRSRPEAPSFDVSLELERGETLGSPLLPGFALGLGELFAT